MDETRNYGKTANSLPNISNLFGNAPLYNRTAISDGVGQAVQNAASAAASAAKQVTSAAKSAGSTSSDSGSDAGSTADYYGTYNSGGAGSGSSSAASNAAAAANQIEIANADADNTRRQLQRQLDRYDFMDRQNQSLRDVNMAQASRQSADNRFDDLTNLANSAMGILGALGPQALQSSGLDTFMQMTARRNLQDSGTRWSELSQNWDTARNSFDEASAQNQASRLDAVIDAEKALADQETALSANLNNLDAGLYQKPGTGSADLGASTVFDDNAVKEHNAVLAGYAMPDYTTQNARATAPVNRTRGTDYFGRQVNRVNGYR